MKVKEIPVFMKIMQGTVGLFESKSGKIMDLESEKLKKREWKCGAGTCLLKAGAEGGEGRVALLLFNFFKVIIF